MSYDIPPPLQHKEKIIFGLTFSQLAYALPAFLLIFFFIFKTKMHISVSGTISVLIACLASFFMFFEGLDKIKNFFNYFRNKEVRVNSEKLKKIVNINEIKNNIIHTSKDKLVILEITPMNFMIKTEEEKEAIITNFQKFLNSLDFSIQLHIISDKISLEDHFAYLEKKTRKFPELFDSYYQFINSSIKENNIKNRRFYLIIKEKDNLEIQTKVCSDKLKSIGLRVRRLKDNNLLNLFHEYVANNKDKKLKDDEIIENYTHFLLAPEKITFSQDFFKLDNTFCSILTVIGYPHSVEMGFLDKIISSGENYDLSLHIEPFPIETTMIQLNRGLQKQQSDIYSDSKRGIINPSLDLDFRSSSFK